MTQPAEASSLGVRVLRGLKPNSPGGGSWNFHQYMHEFKAVSSDAMKPKLLCNFCEVPSTQDGISIITCLRHVFIVQRSRFHQHMMECPSLHAYNMDNLNV